MWLHSAERKAWQDTRLNFLGQSYKIWYNKSEQAGKYLLDYCSTLISNILLFLKYTKHYTKPCIYLHILRKSQCDRYGKIFAINTSVKQPWFSLDSWFQVFPWSLFPSDTNLRKLSRVWRNHSTIYYCANPSLPTARISEKQLENICWKGIWGGLSHSHH